MDIGAIAKSITDVAIEGLKSGVEIGRKESLPLRALLVEALDLVPRISDDDPMAPALADWCRKVRATIQPREAEQVKA